MTGIWDELLGRVGQGWRFAGLFATATHDRSGVGRSSGVRLSAAVCDEDGVVVLDIDVPADDESYPALTPVLGAAYWYERTIHDLFGLVPAGHPRLAGFLLPHRQGEDYPRPGSGRRPAPIHPDPTASPVPVAGPGMFTMAFGPVRSGVVESIEYDIETPGEDVLRMGIRPYVKHRGIAARFTGMSVQDAVLLAERVEGTSSVANALAFSHAVEQIAGVQVPAAAALSRVVVAELERIANHLDVAMKLTDGAALAVATARFGVHKERVLRLQSALTGSRFGRSLVVPGGIVRPLARSGTAIRAEVDRLEPAILADARLAMSTASFIDRLRGTGPISAERATAHGALGPVGKASGFRDDARSERPYDAYDRLGLLPDPTRPDGDVLARTRVRWHEVAEAFHLVRQAVEELDELVDVGGQQLRVPLSDDRLSGRATGWAEGPGGEVLYLVELVDGRVLSCSPRPASFHNHLLYAETYAGDVFTDVVFIEAAMGVSIAGVAL
ncbi:MAG: hydrogenase large subunit [Actinomycetes bacterium]